MNIERRRAFEEACLAMQRNAPHETWMYVSFHEDNESDAFLLAQSMMGNTHLKSLEFRSFSSLKPAVVRALADSIGQSNLTSISFQKIQGKTEDESRCIRTIIGNGIRKCQTITHLELMYLSMSELDGLVDAFSDIQSLECLKINRPKWNHCFGQLVSNVLMQRLSLVSLRLDESNLSDDNFIPVAQGLRNNLSLEYLELCRCRLNDSNLRMFVENWHLDSPLKELNVSSNAIGVEGAQLLLRSIINRPAMQTLNISNNLKIGCLGVSVIGEEFLPHLHLNCLYICCCCITGCQADKLAAGRALLMGLKRNLFIKKFHWDNGFPSYMDDEIRFYARLNQKGRFLLSTDHGLAPTIWTHILCAGFRGFHHCPSVIFFFLREQPWLLQPSR